MAVNLHATKQVREPVKSGHNNRSAWLEKQQKKALAKRKRRRSIACCTVHDLLEGTRDV